MYQDLTRGNITKTIVSFALPMILGNLLQQGYNIADTLIVGQCLGRDALAAVGSAYTLMTFLTSILLGLSMGAGALFSIYQGRSDTERLRTAVVQAFLLIFLICLGLYGVVYLGFSPILSFLRIPEEVAPLIRQYLQVIFAGLLATFLYNFFACLLRALGNSVTPLLFLGVSAVLNVILDLVLVLIVPWGVRGAALATVIAQFVSGLGIALYTLLRCKALWPRPGDFRWNPGALREIGKLSLLTCLQQSVMNFGILMVQGLVNSFGPVIMAAFAAAVKIDSFAYMPVQDFGNAFSTFVAQNYGAGQHQRIREGIQKAVRLTLVFCLAISVLVFVAARLLMMIFVQPQETETIAAGVAYLRIEGACYWGIGVLFLLYGLYRAVKRPAMSLVLTVISLGTRVALAYTLAGPIGVNGIWISIPIGWLLADGVGLLYYRRCRGILLSDVSRQRG